MTNSNRIINIVYFKLSTYLIVNLFVFFNICYSPPISNEKLNRMSQQNLKTYWQRNPIELRRCDILAQSFNFNLDSVFHTSH